jgi:threonyl-tRNA synthetase
MREKYREHGYEEVITPQIFDVELWKRSGHYDNYRDDMFFADAFEEVEERSSSVKPMNCPSHCLILRQPYPLVPRAAAFASPTSGGCTATNGPGWSPG